MSLPNLDNLVKTGQLKLEPTNQLEFSGLLRSGEARLHDAANPSLAAESRFDLAYNAAHSLSLAALRWHGYRSGNRYLVFQVLPHTIGVGPEIWRVLAKCHNCRNVAEYEGYFEIDEQLLKDLLTATQTLLACVSSLEVKMSDFAAKNRLISHTASPQELNQLIQEKIKQITQQGDKPYITVQRQIELLHELAQFDFGRFLLQNKGINGYWTHYMLTYPWKKNHNHQTELEKFLLERAPVVLATQERFKLFLNENQKSVENNKKLACIPCGMMGELLYLNFSEIDDIELIGIDYDASTLEDAKNLAKEKNLLEFTTLNQSDAWNLNLKNEFNLISSNGLNIYEPDNEKVIALYQQFYNALKPNGKLVTSFLTPPPGLADHCEWDMEKINSQDLLLQKIIFADILSVKWQCFRSTQQTKEQLKSVGFETINFIPDKANLFPTVTAIKPQV